MFFGCDAGDVVYAKQHTYTVSARCHGECDVLRDVGVGGERVAFLMAINQVDCVHRIRQRRVAAAGPSFVGRALKGSGVSN